MALAAPVVMTDNDDLDAIADLFEADDATLSDAECVFLAAVATVVRFANIAQNTAVAHDRLGERYGGHTSHLVMQIATLAPHVERELLATVGGLTQATLAGGLGDEAAHQATNLGPVH
mgnify:CR=1 FL=1